MLAEDPAVGRALVVVREDVPGRKRLVAYVLGVDGGGDATGRPDPAALRTRAAERLPDYLVPAAVVVLDRLPVTANGKVDVAALPEPDTAATAGGRPARTPRERLLAGLVAELVGVEEVGVDDDFFALGGDSIVAMQLVSRARRAGLALTTRQVFTHRTVSGLVTVAGVVTGADGRMPEALSLVELTDDDAADLAAAWPGHADVLPLTPLQEGLLFHSGLAEQGAGADAYTVQLEIDLDGPVDAGRLRAAGQALLDRHPQLRAGFAALRSGRTVAVVPARAALPWAEVDLTHRPDDLAAELDRERARPFDPARPPLLRMLLIRTAPDSHRLVLTHHHVLLDGWSRSPLLAELGRLYDAAATGADPAGLPRPAPYGAFLAWLATRDRQRSLAAWRRALAGLDEGTLLATADGGDSSELPEALPVPLPGATRDGLRALARARGRHARHRGPGRVGSRARPAHRPRRRRLRCHRRRPAAGAAGCRVDARPVHQHGAGAGAARPGGDRRRAADPPAGRAGRPARPPAPRPRRDPAGRGRR